MAVKTKILILSPHEPYRLMLWHATGMPLTVTFTLYNTTGTKINPDDQNLQLILLPRSRGGAYAYDIPTYDAVNSLCQVNIPGAVLTDPQGYSLEIYNRDPPLVPGNPPTPRNLLVVGSLALKGLAYASGGALAPVSYPVIQGPPGEPGIQGPKGDKGDRGSIWESEVGPPSEQPGDLVGDMHLDETTGNVYRKD